VHHENTFAEGKPKPVVSGVSGRNPVGRRIKCCTPENFILRRADFAFGAAEALEFRGQTCSQSEQ